jgi:hypothetical protein
MCVHVQVRAWVQPAGVALIVLCIVAAAALNAADGGMGSQPLIGLSSIAHVCVLVLYAFSLRFSHGRLVLVLNMAAKAGAWRLPTVLRVQRQMCMLAGSIGVMTVALVAPMVWWVAGGRVGPIRPLSITYCVLQVPVAYAFACCAALLLVVTNVFIAAAKELGHSFRALGREGDAGQRSPTITVAESGSVPLYAWPAAAVSPVADSDGEEGASVLGFESSSHVALSPVPPAAAIVVVATGSQLPPPPAHGVMSSTRRNVRFPPVSPAGRRVPPSAAHVARGRSEGPGGPSFGLVQTEDHPSVPAVTVSVDATAPPSARVSPTQAGTVTHSATTPRSGKVTVAALTERSGTASAPPRIASPAPSVGDRAAVHGLPAGSGSIHGGGSTSNYHAGWQQPTPPGNSGCTAMDDAALLQRLDALSWLRAGLHVASSSMTPLMVACMVTFIAGGLVFLYLFTQRADAVIVMYAAAHFAVPLFFVFRFGAVSSAAADVLLRTTQCSNTRLRGAVNRQAARVSLATSQAAGADAMQIGGVTVTMTTTARLASVLATVIVYLVQQTARAV